MITTLNSQKGLTLLELLIVLSIVSILLSTGVPSFRNAVMDSRMVDGSNAFASSISAARSSAIRFQRQVTICPIDDYEAALLSCSNDTDWTTGWMVWVDQDRDGATTANEILSTQQPLHASLSFDSGAADDFTYDGRGFLISGGDDLVVCDSRTGEEGRIIRVNGIGRTSVARQVCP